MRIPSKSPLAWWHTTPADELGATDVAALRCSLDGLAILGLPNWLEPTRLDVTAAIAVAIDLVRSDRVGSHRLDIAMTTILISTLIGDPAAKVLLAHVLHRLGETAPRYAELGDSWSAAKRRWATSNRDRQSCRQTIERSSASDAQL